MALLLRLISRCKHTRGPFNKNNMLSILFFPGALRIFKHVFFHKNFESLSMTLVLLGIFGTITERQIGTVRFLYTFLILTVTYSVLTVVVAIGLAFTTYFAAVMYRWENNVICKINYNPAFHTNAMLTSDSPICFLYATTTHLFSRNGV